MREAVYLSIVLHFYEKVNVLASRGAKLTIENGQLTIGAMAEEQTIFHKIVAGEIPADVVYEDDAILAFKDIHPKAATHLLFIAKREEDFVPSIADVTEATAHVPGMLLAKAKEFAASQGIDGYKLTFHVGKGGGQEVFYLHLHFMSEQPLPS